MEVTIENDDPVTGELTLKVSFDVVNQSGAAANVTSAQVWPVNPRLVEQPTPIPVTQTQQGNTVHCEGTWNLLADTPEELGTWSFVADAEVNEAEAAVVPEGAGNTETGFEVTGVALGYRIWEDQQQTRPVPRAQAHEPYADYYVLFRTFLRVNRHGQGPQWYSSDAISEEQLAQYVWIGQWAPNGLPQSAERLPDDARSPGTLDLYVEWRAFDNVVAKHTTNPHKTERWYGMKAPPTTIDSGLTSSGFVDMGTVWWGGRVEWRRQQNGPDGNGERHRMVCLLPTDRSDNAQVIRLVDGNTEYHGNIPRSGDARFNWVTIGRTGNTMRQKLWKPNPWNGRISGRDVWDDNPRVPDENDDIFAPNDPFFDNVPEAQRQQARQKQGDFNQQVLEWAYSFYFVPYSWGGSSYGGKQSEGMDDLTCSNTRAHPPSGIVDGGRGFGIDCSGLVCRCAMLSGLGVPRLNTTGLADTIYASDITWQTLRPGDFPNRREHHVVYAIGNAVLDQNNNVVSVPTIEASGGDHMVLERERRRGFPDYLERYVPRRWIAP